MPYSDRSMKPVAQILSWLSFEKDTSREPATVPVVSSATKGEGEHVNVADRCISLGLAIVFKKEVGGMEKNVGWRSVRVTCRLTKTQ